MEQPAKNLREKKLHRERVLLFDCLMEVEDEMTDEMREKRDAE
jgi:hypothetical protein